MKLRLHYLFATALLLGGILSVAPALAQNTTFGQRINPLPECNDGMDNDADGHTDYPNDPDCDSTGDNSESTPPPPAQPEKPQPEPSRDSAETDSNATRPSAEPIIDESTDSPDPDEAIEKPPVTGGTGQKSDPKDDSDKPGPGIFSLVSRPLLWSAVGFAAVGTMVRGFMFTTSYTCKDCRDRRYSMHPQYLRRMYCECCRNKHYPHKQTVKKRSTAKS